jgi:peptidyl-prolyl cis-trans isomerase A (cyclophilin A)
MATKYSTPPTASLDAGKTYTAVIETTLGTMEVELFADKAPETVGNFVGLAHDGFYDGIIFHRVIDGFMIQGGDPDGQGTGGPGYKFKDEQSALKLPHDGAGVLSMANAGPNTNGSQFFITLEATPHLNGRHAVFGKVTGGEDVLHKIGTVKTGAQDRPIDEVVMNKVTIREA